MNLFSIVKPALQSHMSFVDMGLFLYTGSTFDSGVLTPEYSDYIPVSVNVQLYNNQKLMFENNTLTTTVYKKLFINAPVSGLNRDIGTGGDFLIWDNPTINAPIKYRVVMVINKFPYRSNGLTYGTEVVCVESGFSDG